MEALKSMISKMEATGIYKLNSNTLVNYELEAYAEGLNIAVKMINELENESFVATASKYGLLNREKMFKISTCKNTEKRRYSIIERCSITPNSFTKADMEQAFKMEGQNAEICENTAENKLYVNCMEVNEADKGKIVNTAKMFLPAHLYAELDFRSISWNNIDSKNESFETKESFGFSWNDIDNFENGLFKI